MKKKECLLQMIEELRSNPQISIKQCEIGNPLSDATIEIIKSGFDIDVPADLIDFLRKHNGVKLTWGTDENHTWNRMSENDTTLPFGKIHIPDLETMIADPYYGQWEGYLWGEDIFPNIDEETRDYYKTLIPFDFPGIDHARTSCVCMKREKNGSLNTNLTFFEFPTGTMSFNYNLEEYINLLCQTKGFEFWHYAANGYEKYQKLIEHYFPQIFPDKPLLKFKE